MLTSKSILAITASLALSTLSFAGPKTYQVTGPIIEVTDTSVTVQKGDEKWEVARDGKTKITGVLKVGSKVTVTYTMSAVSAEVKADAKADAKAPAPAPKAEAPKKGKKAA